VISDCGFRIADWHGGLSVRVLGILDYWNTFAKHDSMFQKSLLLSHAPSPNVWKTSWICEPAVPKMLEFAPPGQSSKNPKINACESHAVRA
jgi:hypothetical protein